jgi:hypothetical protein
MWAVDETGDDGGLASLSPGRALALVGILTVSLALAVVPATLPVTLQPLHLEQLTPGLAGLAAVVGGVKFLAMAGGVTARLLARPPSAMAIAPGD